MIIVPINGRTGNNLFQYAAGRALAGRLGSEVVIDTSWASERKQQLARYLMSLPLKAHYNNRGYRFKRQLLRIGLRQHQFHRGHVHWDTGLFYDPKFEQLTDGTMLWGFFQCPRYFSHIENELRKEIDLTYVAIPEESMALETRLKSEQTASIHIRRGDYLNFSATQCLSGNYYKKAIHWLKKQIPGVRFCVFSDDPEWCRREFTDADFTVCDLPGSSSTPLHDMRLMAACSHHIIANSSYSWWGAWLNPSPDKFVIAPKMWMTSCPSDPVVPESWIKIG